MQKYLLILIALLCTASVTKAGELSYDIGGEMRAFYGYIDVAERFTKDQNDYKTFGYAELNLATEYQTDTDINLGLYLDVMKNFNRSTRTLNNGSWGKELYGIVDSPYGRVMLGETYNVAYQFHQGPNPSMIATNYLTNPNWRRKENSVFYKTLNSTAINTDGVAPKFTYISPAFANTNIGLTYVNDINNRRGLVNHQLSYQSNNGYIAAIYNEFSAGSIDIASSLAYAEFHEHDKELAASLRLSRGNWSLASGYRKTYVEGKRFHIAQDLSDNYREGHVWDIGLEFEFGPLKSSLTYLNSKSDNTDNEDRLVTFANKYQINKWADIYLGAAHIEYQAEDRILKKNNQGYIFMTGLGLKF